MGNNTSYDHEIARIMEQIPDILKIRYTLQIDDCTYLEDGRIVCIGNALVTTRLKSISLYNS